MKESLTRRLLRRLGGWFSRSPVSAERLIKVICAERIRKDEKNLAHEQAAKDEQAALMEAHFEEVEAERTEQIRQIYAGNSMMHGFDQEFADVLYGSCQYARSCCGPDGKHWESE